MSSLLQTPLHALHVELGAKMVPFAGYDMPVQYPSGVMAEHKHTRAAAGLFDVSHMGQVRLVGADAAAALETLVPVDIIDLGVFKQRYALFTNEQGGLLDDLMVCRRPDDLFVVVNAGCKDQDIAHMQKHIGARCEVIPVPERALLALQGPQAVDVLSRLNPEVAKLTFMTGGFFTLDGIDTFLTRSGYTGEDGYEISVHQGDAVALARKLLRHAEVKPIGLGARDSLRLEAGLCLYGHDINESTTPVEASITWPSRRSAAPVARVPAATPARLSLTNNLPMVQPASASAWSARSACPCARAPRSSPPTVPRSASSPAARWAPRSTSRSPSPTLTRPTPPPAPKSSPSCARSARRWLFPPPPSPPTATTAANPLGA